jgi:hypothetical protein
MRKLRARDSVLAEHIQSAIDGGKDVEETESLVRRRKKARVYRKTVRFTDEEALRVAVDALQVYFIEQPLFVNSANKNFESAALGTAEERPRPAPSREGQAQEDDCRETSV